MTTTSERPALPTSAAALPSPARDGDLVEVRPSPGSRVDFGVVRGRVQHVTPRGLTLAVNTGSFCAGASTLWFAHGGIQVDVIESRARA